MTQKSLSNRMKLIIVLLGLCGAALFGIAVPVIGLDLVDSYPEFSYCFLPWLIFILLMAVPCYAVLVIAWKIATSIENDNSFTELNSKRLKNVSVLSLATSIYLFVGATVFLLLSMCHFSMFLGACLVSFVGIAISVASAVLSYLVKKAAALQEQSDLTI